MSVKETVKKALAKIGLNSDGSEILDPKPLNIPVGMKRRPTQEERFRAIMAAHEAQKAEDQEYSDETDFDIDEPDILTPHEHAGIVYDLEPQILAEDSLEPSQEPATPIAEDPPPQAPASPQEKTEG